jgi:hypothetical protein
MNARDFEKKTPQENRFAKPEMPGQRKTRLSLWDRELDLETTADKIKFLITLTIIGLVCIFAGDGLIHLTFKTSGIALNVVGWIIIAVGVFGPIFKAMEQTP